MAEIKDERDVAAWFDDLARAIKKRGENFAEEMVALQSERVRKALDQLVALLTGKGDPLPLNGKSAVRFGVAERYLGIGERQREKLIKGQSPALIAVGRGRNRRVTVKSLLDYLPPDRAEYDWEFKGDVLVVKPVER
jgi:hypothetical protein